MGREFQVKVGNSRSNFKKMEARINVSKTSYTIFSQNKKRESELTLLLNGSKILYEKYPNYLGICFARGSPLMSTLKISEKNVLND